MHLGLAGAGVVLVALQFVPYGRDHTNPPVTRDAPWPSADARRLAVRACYDCHSHETRWPLYSRVAPFSWLVTRDVAEGRDELNFSRWDRDDGEADDAADTIADGTMPPRRYLLLHPDARLSDGEQDTLVGYLQSMDAGDDDGGGRGRGRGRGGDDGEGAAAPLPLNAR